MSSPMKLDHLDTSPSETVRRHASTFRQVRQARHDALSDGSSDGSAIPEPEVPQREALSDEVPTGARRLAAVARGAGWGTFVAYSRSATGVDAVSVRARRPGELVVGYWRAGKFAWGLVARLSDGLRKVGARELKARLEDRPAVVPSDEKR
jgi:hypothetical protein